MSSSVHFDNNVNKPNNILNNKIMNVNIKNSSLYSSTITSAVKMLNYKNIAPAPAPATTEYKSIAPAPIDVGVKNRKYAPRATSTPPYSVDQTQSVQRRNARERNRVKQVNNSFARLRQHLPQHIVSDMTKSGGRGPHKKISKVDTLRIAVAYIRRLEDLIEDLGGSECLGTSSESTSNSNIITGTSTSTSTMQSQIYYTSTSPQPEFQQQTMLFQQSTQLPQQQCFSSTLLTPVSLAAFSPVHTKIDLSCHSPTASYISNTSFDSGTYEPAQQLSPEPYNDAAAGELAARSNANLALKFEPYENFRLDEEDCTPDDDDIIDYISLWQEEQQASQN